MSIPQLELESLMHETLPLAKRMLQQEGAVIPYGAVMRCDGEVQPVAVEPGSPAAGRRRAPAT